MASRGPVATDAALLGDCLAAWPVLVLSVMDFRVMGRLGEFTGQVGSTLRSSA